MELRLADLLVRAELVTREQVATVMDDREPSGSGLVSHLISTGAISETRLMEFLSQQFGMEEIALWDSPVDNTALQTLPLSLVQKRQIVPWRINGSTLELAVSDPTDLASIHEVRFITGRDVRVVLARPSSIQSFIDRHFGSLSYESVLKKFSLNSTEVVHEEEMHSEDFHDAAREAPVVALVNAILTDAAMRRASDVHIEPYERVLRVRFRIDGVLQQVMSPPVHLKHALASRVKVIAGLDIAERRLPQDGRFRLRADQNRELDVRVSVLPTLFGEKVVMRLLDKSNLQMDLESLGLESDSLRKFRAAIGKPYGMLLMTGPTGSGKSTTLYSMLAELNLPGVNISTAEDPIEYNLVGVNQVQTHDDIGLSFAACLRTFLRQDPDIIMVGEIRDGETAEIAVKAALTGHLVLSTLHTNDAPSSVARLISMGVEPYLIGSSLNLVAAQRLVRRICPHCKVKEVISPAVFASLGLAQRELSAGFHAFRGTGCAECDGTGYRGRSAIYEVMTVEGALQQRIMEGRSGPELRRDALGLGLSSLRAAALRKVTQGITTVEETVRVTDADRVWENPASDSSGGPRTEAECRSTNGKAGP